MISNLQMITIYVSNIDSSLDFYINKLGFKKTAEFNDKKGTRLVWVIPSSARKVPLATEIALCEVSDSDPRIGKASGIVFTAENIEETYKELKKNGVKFSLELLTHDYGKGGGDQEARFLDPDKNEFLLHT